ncbi:alpha/beta hydrolase [Halalkalirubrum salinum]|uniref:alpha/beta hydrolase n=1 Tax=Halalkalirubrum salinum TaxID=2563889 RepID=UPI0010FBBC2E|nr:dienelactone hydrolase family protein [Halalkalirubrum salinum]
MTEILLEHVHLEAEIQSDGPAPAVFVLHGRGANEQDLLPIADELPDELHVISFRAPDRLQGGYTWYDLDLSGGGLHESQPDAEGFRRSLDLVTGSIDAAVEAYDLDPDRLGLLGFSQGSIMSLALLLESPDRIAWVAALHGYLADSHADLDPDSVDDKPVFIAAGRADRIIPHTRTEAAADRLRSIGADVTVGVYDAGHGVGPAELSDLVDFVTTTIQH